MGKLVTFWSPYAGKSKVTSTMCAVVAAFGMQYPEFEAAVTHINPDSMDLEERLDYRVRTEEKKELYETTGLSSMALNYMQAVLTPEKIRRCSIPLFMKSLHLFPGFGKKEFSEEILFHLLTEYLMEEFAVVFLDLGSGEKNLSVRLMEKADLIVPVFPQYPFQPEYFFSAGRGTLKEKEYLIVLGGYMEKSKYSRKYYERRYRDRGMELGTIPENTGFFDAMADGNVLDFFLKNQYAEKKEENYEFVVQAKKTAECIQKKLFVS